MAWQSKHKRISISDSLGAHVFASINNTKPELFNKNFERFECALRETWHILPLSHRRAILRQLRKHIPCTLGVTNTGKFLNRVYLRVHVGYVERPNVDAHVNTLGQLYFRRHIFNAPEEFMISIMLHEILHLAWWGYGWQGSGKHGNYRTSIEHVWIQNECKRLGYDETTTMLNYYRNKG